MPIFLRQSTASQEIPLGYFVDSTDGNTEETGLTIANTDIKIWKTGATTNANKNSGGATHIANGLYYAVLDATDTDTIGPLVVFVHVAGALAVRVECCVLDEAMYDWQFGTVAPLAPTTAGRTLDVTATGAAGIDWGNVENPTTAVNLSATNIDVDQVVASVTGAVGSVTGAVGSVTGSVGSVTGAVGSVTGSVGSVTGAVGSVTAAVTVGTISANVVTASALAADAVAEIADGVWDEAIAGHLGAGTTGAALNGATAPTAAAVADAVWDEAMADHLAGGSTGASLNGAGSAGDPWTTALPGAYGAGTAGYIVGTNLDAAVSTRASQTSLDTLDNYVDTEVADIQARLPAALVGGRIDASVGAMAANVVTAAAIATDAIDADAIAANAIDASALAADAVAEIADGVWDEATAGHQSAGTTGLSLTSASAPSAATVADAVWDEARAGHVAAGSFGEGVNVASGGFPVGGFANGAITTLSVGTGVTVGTTAQGGSRTVTVHVETGAGASIPDVSVSIYDSTGTTGIDRRVTNANGDAVFTLDDGAYDARLLHAGYSFTVPEEFTVSADQTTTFTGTAVTVPADTSSYESRPLRRQKVRYNSTNLDTPIKYQRVLNGAKATPSSATITIYDTDGTTTLLAATAMSVSGTVCSYSVTTTTTASWPVATGYRARIAATIGGVVYYDDILFDVCKFVLALDVSVDQLTALDDRISAMAHDGDEDFSEVIEAIRDELHLLLEMKATEGKMMLEDMMVDKSRVSIPARYRVLAQIFQSKQNYEAAKMYQEQFDKLWKAVLAGVKLDSNQDMTESSQPKASFGTRLRF